MFKRALIASALITLCGCIPVVLTPGIDDVRADTKDPTKRCRYVGNVKGKRDDALVNEWVSHHPPKEGAIIAIKKEALKRGGNYVWLTGGKNIYSKPYEKDVAYIGKAYHCPEGFLRVPADNLSGL